MKLSYRISNDGARVVRKVVRVKLGLKRRVMTTPFADIRVEVNKAYQLAILRKDLEKEQHEL